MTNKGENAQYPGINETCILFPTPTTPSQPPPDSSVAGYHFEFRLFLKVVICAPVFGL